MKGVLFNADLAAREFGMKAVRVEQLLQWADGPWACPTN
jgi:uncharacterized protein YfaT (DUF1175 family)